MKMKYLPIVSAAFLILAMTIQFFVSYRSEKKRVIERIDSEIELAQKDFIFELYDIQDAGEEMQSYVLRHIDEPLKLLHQTRVTLRRYPDILACYVSFRPGFYDEEDYWFCPCSWRKGDSIAMAMYGDKEHDYFKAKWYKGALTKDLSAGYWSSSYLDEDFSEPIFTHSVRVDKDGEMACVVGFDFSMIWVDKMLEDIKPFDEACCVLYNSNGTVMLTSDNMGKRTELNDKSMIIRSSMLSPMDLRLEVGVPKSYIWKSVRNKMIITFFVLMFGIIVAGLLIRRIWKNQAEYARVQTENKVIEREMHIASTIQMGILRKGQRSNVKGDKWTDVMLQAALVPMKEVGGDLYDYFRKENDRFFIIGDVSGKSVPAAMFMSATVNLFRSAVRRLQSPKAIMEDMNAVLSDNNPSMMFVTAFIGRLHIPTGELLYCNAGHLAPIVYSMRQESEATKILSLEPNIPMGYEGRFKFKEQGTMLRQDEMLVLYTDGITEARNEQHEMLGSKRWIDIITKHHNAFREGDFEAISNIGLQFVGKAEQTDDMTIMTITKTSAEEPVSLRVENKMDQWPALRNILHNYALCAGMDTRALKKLEVALEEAVVNVIHYSQAGWIELHIESQITDNALRIAIRLSDDGVAFDPTAQAEKDIEKAAEERQIGGLGIALVKQIADHVSYRRIEDKNELTIIKNI